VPEPTTDPPDVETDDTPVEVPPLDQADPTDVIAALGFDPAAVATVIISAAGVHAIATTLVEPDPAPMTEETPDADQ
jgi:hypothetical protein